MRTKGTRTAAELREKFGLRLRKLRTARNLTQEDFAESAGISVDFLSLIERGRSAPSFENLQTIADAMKVSVAYLFDFSERSR